MPQLSPDFWALNFLTAWTLLALVLATTMSLQLPLPPSGSSLTSLHSTAPEWLWT